MFRFWRRLRSSRNRSSTSSSTSRSGRDNCWREELFRYLIHYVLLISVAAVLMGTLNSMHKFLVPAVAPLWFSVAVIGSILALHHRMGVYAMVVGVLIGGAGQLALQIPPVLRAGYRLLPRFEFRDPHFRTILRHWVPVVSTASVFAVNQQIALLFASGLADGSGSAMTNALVFWQLPFGIFSASITTVLFPVMSRSYAEEDYAGLRTTVQRGLRGLILLLVPAGIGLIVLGEPIIAVALQRGAFSRDATVLASRVLVGYSVGLFSVGAFTFLQRFFYACGDYRTPLAVAAVTMVLDVGLSLWLKETVLGVVGALGGQQRGVFRGPGDLPASRSQCRRQAVSHHVGTLGGACRSGIRRGRCCCCCCQTRSHAVRWL